MNRRTWNKGVRCAAIAAMLLVSLAAKTAQAAGGAFAVDDAEVEGAGNCKVETWGSFSGQRDFIGVVSPACVFNLVRPFEFNAQFSRERSGGEWGTGLTLKAKTNILPVETGRLGVALQAGTGFDLRSGQNSGVFFVVPFTYAFSDRFRVNVNAGWSWDRPTHEHAFVWGAGLELKVAQPVTVIAEVFGDTSSGSRSPRLQTGLRFTPREWFDIDVIYGRNITGDVANWITVGLNLRFEGLLK